MRYGLKVIEKMDLTELNSYRIKSICKKAYFPDSEKELIALLKDNSSKPLNIIGNGNNIILSKEYYETPFIILNKCFDKIVFENGLLIAEAGATLLKLSEIALHYGLTGLEEFYDIPSSVGGAIVMNAGNKDKEIKDVITKIRFLDLNTLEVSEITSEQANFSYRNSFFQEENNHIILKAWFKLSPGDPSEIQHKMLQGKKLRWAKQPREYPNSGSVFKRPEGRFVGPMLDELNLKGLSIGGAQVSTKHSGFIVNKGCATGQDILSLISEIQRRVKMHFGIELVVEQRIIS
ncbi:UDP-N-acetylmuramate dehydrogenase [Psychrobacter sanguinis]|uniref:UDP-N-acetylmuramate dehydrogenase n=1 Tax=Psychrobacter sanguinis TaxID=861445 RepID=UPI002234C181|nr:UDP-N-acetylmuramate dehydrogenase [Psychrobacter sanguinis]